MTAPYTDLLPWAPPRVGLPVERRDSWEVAIHGTRAGLLAGVALGAVEMAASAILNNDPWLPFDFAAALIVGPEALTPAFPLGGVDFLAGVNTNRASPGRLGDWISYRRT